jgi:adenylyltransferase/sulfurtransferase
MPEVGVDGQRKLKAGSVLCIGAGGLGSPAAMYLAAAGVGRIGVVDFDVVDFSNLQRQIIHGTPDVGRSKLASAKDRLVAINPHVDVQTYETALSSENALQLFEPYDVILDGTDNFPTRYLTNDACVLLGKPNAYGSIFRFEGQASVFATKDGPCYRCLYPEPPPPRPRSKLRRGRCPRSAARRHRRDSGNRSHQADRRNRRAVDRPFSDLRRAPDAFP